MIISEEQSGGATGVEAAILVDDVLPLSLGMERQGRWELAGLHTLKGFMGQQMCWILGEPVQCPGF